MPDIFLSPSLKTGNYYINVGTEAQFMGYLADALEPYLTVNGIGYTRSRLPNTLANAIAQSNMGNYNLHLALHSNASPEGKEGQFRGIQAYYYPTSVQGRRAAEALVNSLKQIYPDPELVYIVPTTTIAEVRRTKAPAVLMEIGYHDNLQDAEWIKQNIQNIARALAQGLTAYFGLPFKEVCNIKGENLNTAANIQTNAYVNACTNDGSALYIRSGGYIITQIVGRIPSGQMALLLERPQNGWARLRYNAVEGYASANYLCTCVSDQTARTGTVNTSGSNLNLRSAPSVTASIIGRIPDGSTVRILDSAGAWYRVSYMGATGYVLSDFIVV